MISYFGEPTLAELLSDPLTRSVMQADRVNLWELEEMLRGMARLHAESPVDRCMRLAIHLLRRTAS